jgi:hypothetical protein
LFCGISLKIAILPQSNRGHKFWYYAPTDSPARKNMLSAKLLLLPLVMLLPASVDCSQMWASELFSAQSGMSGNNTQLRTGFHKVKGTRNNMEHTKYNELLPSTWLRDTNQILHLMKVILPPYVSKNNEVALLGSAALALFQEEHRCGPMWGCPSDYDFFVAGSHGRNQETFLAFVEYCVQRIRELGYTVLHRESYLVYARNGAKIVVSDISLGEVTGKISFVQSPGCKTVQEVAEQFDVDVCKVIYNIDEETVTCDKEVHMHIHHGVALVSDFALSGDSNLSAVTEESIKQLNRVFARILKYQDRGFSFLNVKKIAFM